jgi:uncharacterized protein
MAGTARKTALIVRGGWDGHQPVQTTNSVIPFLEANGYTVQVKESATVYADAAFMETVDLIVQVNTMSSIAEDDLAGLIAAVKNGTGLAGWHGGIADAYRNSPDYLQLIGGQFAHHPRKAPSELLHHDGRDYFIPYTVNIVPDKADHPVVAGLTDFDLVTEQYWVLSDVYNDVLATTTLAARPTDPWHVPVTVPAVWTRQWGEGRIFVCTPGHTIDVLHNPNVRSIIERGLLWASR